MTDLTEKWKAGELNRGKEYWCKVEGEGVLLCYLTFSTNKFTRLSGYQSKCLPDDDILEILALCDYEELQSLKEENARLNKKLEIAVAALKEYATIQTHDWIDSQRVAKKSLTQIDEVK